MAIYNVDVTSVAQLGKEADGHPSVSSLSCHSQVGDVDIEFHGGARYSRAETGRHGAVVGISCMM